MDSQEDQSSRVPSALNYSDVMEAGSPAGDFQIVTNLPNNGGTFLPNQTVNFAINVPVNAFADLSRAYLKFTLNNTGGTHELYLDRAIGAASVIDSMKVISPTGGPLSDIQHYNALCALINDYTAASHVDGVLNVRQGASEAPLGRAPIGTETATISNRVTVAHSTGISVCHVPEGGIWSCDRYLPLGFINGQLQVQIGLADNGGGVTCAKDETTTWSTSGWELHIPVVKTGEEFNANLRQLMGSGVNLNIHMDDWTNQQATIASGTTGGTDILLANRKRSVKSVFAMFRPSASLSDIEIESASARRTCGLTAYQYSVAGVEMPSKQIAGGPTDLGEYMANTEMAWGRIGSSISASVATRANYYATDDRTNGSLVVFPLDLEAYKGVLSGKNLSSAMPLIFKPVLGSGNANFAAATGAVTCDVFSKFDSVLTLSGLTGSLTVSS